MAMLNKQMVYIYIYTNTYIHRLHCDALLCIALALGYLTHYIYTHTHMYICYICMERA